MSTDTSRRDRPLHAIRRNAGELRGDIWELLELQLRLLQLDFARAQRRLIRAAVAAVAAFLILFCTLLMFSLALAYLLTDYASLPMWGSTAVVGVVDAVVVGVLALLMLRWARRGLSSFERSRSELRRNLQWVKHVVKGSDGKAL
jgi:hypothetical protein